MRPDELPWGVVVTCEHAAWQLPDGVELGVDEACLRSQASWDHGALEIAQQLAIGLRVPVFAGEFSRLFVDLNRPATHPDVVPTWCYGAHVPRNAELLAEARQARIAAYHAPHWRRVEQAVEDASHSWAGADGDGDGDGRKPTRTVLHLASHSFCTELDPVNRTYDVGLLFDPGRPVEVGVVEVLERVLAGHGLSVRRNEPYLGNGPGLPASLREKYEAQRYVGITIETSHAVTMSAGGTARVAVALSRGLDALGVVPDPR